MTEPDKHEEDEEQFEPTRFDKAVAMTLASPIMAAFFLILTLVITPLLAVQMLWRGEYRVAFKLLATRVVPAILVVAGIYLILRSFGWVT